MFGLSKITLCIISLLLICINVQASVIPNSGKFFYSILTMGVADDGQNDINTMYLPVLISNQTDHPSYRLGFSTTKNGIYVFSINDTKDEVPKKYNYSASPSVQPSTVPDSTIQIKSVYSKIFGPNITMNVEHKEEQFKLQLGMFDKEINFTDFNFGIMSKNSGDSKDYTSYVLDGYIGIVPYDSNT